MMGKVAQINVNPHGGVPKYRVSSARLNVGGVEGDKQNNRRFHGGPTRAVCLFSLEVIDELRAEGHSISPGSTGENLTVTGLDWAKLAPGTRLQIGEAQLEITFYTRPCFKIGASFVDEEFNRIKQKNYPGQSRLYARVLEEGIVREGDEVRVLDI